MPPLTSHVGRRREAAQIRAALNDVRLVTLTGTGGVGKTRLAVATMPEAAARFAGGAVFVELAELRDGDLLPNLVAERLGLSDRSGRPIVQVVLDLLRDRALLLVLDNCEHLVEACTHFVAAVLAECPQVAVLATSRQSLGLPGEHVLPVPPLAVPDEDAAQSPLELVQYDSVRLLADRAAAVVPSFEVTSANAAAVAAICRQLDGVPLAIELAAARLRSLSPRQLADRLSRRLPILTGAPRTAPERQRTLRATIDWSYELCSDAEQLLWARASVFAGSFEMDAAEQVCADADLPADMVLDTIEGLLDKSVLLREERGEVVRYRMLEALREHGQELLGTDTAVARRHRDWIDRLTATADAEWCSERQLDWTARLRLEHANLRTALDWSLSEPGEAGAALRIASRLNEYWTLRGASGEARQWLDRALAATPADHPDRPVALSTCALHALLHSDVPTATKRLKEADELATVNDDDLTKAHRTYVHGLAEMIRISPRAVELAEAAAEGFRALGDVRRELHPLFIHGTCIAYQGDIEAARASLRRMLTLSQERGESFYRAMALFGIVFVEVDFGDIALAAEAARDGFVVGRTFSSGFRDAYHLEALAWVADGQGEHERAATLFGAAATAWEAAGASPEIAVALPHNRHKHSTRHALGAVRFAEFFAAGRALSDRRRVRLALAEDDTPTPGTPPGDLTRREWEVAELVAKGLSNRSIADRLVISPRTADTHVQNILGKLGFHNRAQIASWATHRRRPE
ncbi:LuxR C-terminal-related transcriptional regulator [Thermomonospora umbrina]|uniref:Putative ATPase n=1 Tax=Thermomonospora umbrina TaxID=111806 RepID=A0A3D9SRD4_9ACTN|nr:LuxR C-terminal-related transcriptional regulator [Thermomonospora umbrina]REE95194.1 putative ATPase [Thermomonospora umbrina]